MGLVRTYATALDVDALDACADAFASCADNFWIPRAALEAGAVRTALEAEVVRLYHGLMRDLLPPGLAGAEFWVQARAARGAGAGAGGGPARRRGRPRPGVRARQGPGISL
jgi:hypothetical protein